MAPKKRQKALFVYVRIFFGVATGLANGTGENALPNEEAEEMRGLRADVARNEFLIALNCRRAARRFSWLSSLKARSCVRGR